MDYKTLLEMAAAKTKEAKAILDKYPEGELPDEERTRVDALLREAEDLGQKAAKLEEESGFRAKARELYDFFHKPEERPAMGEDKTGQEPEWKSFGEFLLAVALATSPAGKVDSRLRTIEAIMSSEEKAALAEAAGATGGFLVPTEFRAQLLAVAAEKAIVRPRAFTIPMATRSVQIPALDQTTVPTGGSAFFGGMVFYWTEEAAAKTEAEPAFRQIELVAHELCGYSRASNALLADSAISLEALLTRLFGEGMAWTEDYNFLRGDGVGKPLGVINAGATIWVNRNTANDFKFVDAVTMVSKLLPSSYAAGRAVWVMSQSVMPKLYQMQDAASQYIWIPNAAQKGPGTLLGLPIIFTEKLPTLGTKGDVLLCDFSYYLIGDRQAVTIDSSIHERFRYNQRTWRCVERVDGQPWMSTYFTLADGSTTVSPFVGLDVPSS